MEKVCSNWQKISPKNWVSSAQLSLPIIEGRKRQFSTGGQTMIFQLPKVFRVKVFLIYFVGGFFLVAFGSVVAWINHFFGTVAWIVTSLAVAFWLAYTLATEPDDSNLSSSQRS